MDDIRVIAFDADDTLWECGAYYADVQERFCDLICRRLGCEFDIVSAKFDDIEARNMPILGYGAKAMTISMIETAVTLNPKTSSEDILKIIELGESLLDMPVGMLKDVESTIKKLSRRYRIMIITQGDILEQKRKFDKSPLSRDIEFIVVPEKTADSFFEILKRNNIHPNNFLMVGDSPKSDILPVIELGGYAAYLPSSKTWSLEVFGLVESERLIQLKELRNLLTLLKC